MFHRWLTGNMSSREMSECSRSDRWSDSGCSLVSVRRWMLDDLPKLRGKNLACWCMETEKCHADALLEIANSEAA